MSDKCIIHCMDTHTSAELYSALCGKHVPKSRNHRDQAHTIVKPYFFEMFYKNEKEWRNYKLCPECLAHEQLAFFLLNNV